eukprot:238915_1
MIQDSESNEIYFSCKDDDAQNIFYSPITVKWLDCIIYYSPMWITTKSNGQTRSCITNAIGIFVATTATLFYFACDMYATILYWSEYHDIDNMVWICLKSVDLIESFIYHILLHVFQLAMEISLFIAIIQSPYKYSKTFNTIQIHIHFTISLLHCCGYDYYLY